MAEKIVVKVEGLTLGELEEFEEITGLSLTALDGSTLPMKAVTALTYISERRKDASYTLEQARAVRLDEIDIQAGGDADPTSAVEGPAA